MTNIRNCKCELVVLKLYHMGTIRDIHLFLSTGIRRGSTPPTLKMMNLMTK